MQRVCVAVHPNGRLVPVRNDALTVVEREHIVHCDQIRLGVANHELDFGTDTVVHFADPTRSFVHLVDSRREIMQPNVAGRVASKGESDAFVSRNRRLGEGHPHVARSAHENNSVVLDETNGRQGFSRSGGGDVQDQIRPIISGGV